MSECKTSTVMNDGGKHEGKVAVKILNGYWIWWCYKHQQPLAWCEKKQLQAENERLREMLFEALPILDRHTNSETLGPKSLITRIQAERTRNGTSPTGTGKADRRL